MAVHRPGRRARPTEPLTSIRDVLAAPAQRVLGETEFQAAIAAAAVEVESPAARAARRVAGVEIPQPTLPVPHVPKRFQHVTFEQFDPTRTSALADQKSLRIAKNASMKFVTRVLEGRPAMLALIGSEGNGKSHLLYATLHALVTRHVKVYSRPWYRLADELRYGGRNVYTNTMIEPFEVRDHLWTASRVVFLDEVRQTAGTAFDDTELHKFSCWAYDEELCVMLTSNVSPLAEVMGPFAASRYAQLTLTGEDQRQRHA